MILVGVHLCEGKIEKILPCETKSYWQKMLIKSFLKNKIGFIIMTACILINIS